MHDPNETADRSRWDLFRGRRGVISGVAAASLVGGGVASAATLGITQAVDDEPSVSASGDPAVTLTTAAPDKAGDREKDKRGKDKDGGDKRGDKPGSGGDKVSSDTSETERGGGDSSASSHGSRASAVGSSSSGSDSGGSGGSGSGGSGSTKKSSGRDSSSGDRSSNRRTSTTVPSTPAGGAPSPTGDPTATAVTSPSGTEPATTTPDRPQDVAALVGVPVVGGDVPAAPFPVAGETTGGQLAPTTDVEQPADADPASPAAGTEAPTETETSAPAAGGGTTAVDEAPTAPLTPEPLTDGQLDSAFDEALAPGADPAERDAHFEAGPDARPVSDRLAGVTGPAVDLEWSGVTLDPPDPERASAVVDSDGFTGGPLQVALVHTGDGWAVADDSTCAISDALGVPCAP